MLEKLVVSEVKTKDGKFKLTKINDCGGDVKYFDTFNLKII